MRQRQRDAFGRAFELWRAEPDEADRRVRGILPVVGPGTSNTASIFSGKSPGNMAVSVLPSNVSPLIFSPAIGVPMMTGSVSRPCLTVPSRVARTAAMADHVDIGAGEVRPRHGAVGQPPHDRLQPVMAFMVQVVGLGRGEQDAVDAPRRTGR